MELVKGLAARGASLHTPVMTLRHASFLAFIGTLLLTILLVGDFILDLLSLARGLIAVVTLVTALIYAFAALTVTVFFFAFHKTQS